MTVNGAGADNERALMAVVAATADAYLAAVAMYIELTDGPQNVEVFRRLALELLASTIDDMLKATEDM